MTSAFSKLHILIFVCIFLSVSAKTEIQSTTILELAFNPRIALIADVSEKAKSLEEQKGEIGISLFGTKENKTFFAGYSCGFLFENFRHQNLYGIYTGICGNWQLVCGLEFSMANINASVSGLQSAVFANIADWMRGIQLALIFNSLSNGAGAQLALLNEQKNDEKTSSKDRQDLVQIGLMNTSEKILLQIGLLNIQEKKEVQLGLFNFSKENFLLFFPFFNF